MSHPGRLVSPTARPATQDAFHSRKPETEPARWRSVSRVGGTISTLNTKRGIPFRFRLSERIFSKPISDNSPVGVPLSGQALPLLTLPFGPAIHRCLACTSDCHNLLNRLSSLQKLDALFSGGLALQPATVSLYFGRVRACNVILEITLTHSLARPLGDARSGGSDLAQW